MRLRAEGTVVVAHDYFTQRGGAERVATALIEEFQPSQIVTAVVDPKTLFAAIPRDRVRSSFLQAVPGLRRDPRFALILLPFVWRPFAPIDADVLICSSSGWSHALRASTRCFKVVYCHNPARWLYQSPDYLMNVRMDLRVGLMVVRPMLRLLDRRAARSADLYVANSQSVATRISEAYGVRAEVIPPPLSFDATGPQTRIPGLPHRFFLTVGRSRGYKNVDVVVDAFTRLSDEHLVLVGEFPDAPPNVTVLSNLSDAEMRWLYSHATALISMSFEDFGLTPLEANLFGIPCVVLRAGGFLDSVIEGLNGRFVDELTAEAVAEAVEKLPDAWDGAAIRAHAEAYRPQQFAARFRRLIDEARRVPESR